MRTISKIQNLLPALRQALVAFASGRRDGINGNAGVEFGIIAPGLIFMMIGTADLGIGIYRKMQVQNAAQAGANYAAARGFSTDAVTAAVVKATTFSGVEALPAPNKFCGCPSSTGVASADCETSCPNGSAMGTYVSVSAKGTYNTLLPYPLIPSNFPLTAQAIVRIQ